MAIAVLQQRKNLAAAYGTNATHAAIFTADPGTSGTVTGEVTGGSPAYARKAISWGAPDSNGAVTGQVTFDVPAVTILYAGVCSASSGATLLDKVAVTSQTFGTQGTYVLTLTYTQS